MASVGEGSELEAKSLTYNWSVSVPATIHKSVEGPEEVDIDLKDFPNDKVTVSVEISGLPEICPKTASYELSEAPAEEKEEEEGDEVDAAAGYARAANAETPMFSINCPVSVNEGAPLYFNVNVDGSASDLKPTYFWKVSPASISSGQSTPTIKVETKGQGNHIIRAFLSVGSSGLSRTATCATMVKAAPYAYKLDSYTTSALAFEEKEAHLRRFVLRLKAGLEERAYIIAYGETDSAKEEAYLARRYLIEEHGIDAARIVIMRGGQRRKETVIELWVVQPGAPLPFGRSSVID